VAIRAEMVSIECSGTDSQRPVRLDGDKHHFDTGLASCRARDPPLAPG
jgi:hypothetical protein